MCPQSCNKHTAGEAGQVSAAVQVCVRRILQYPGVCLGAGDQCQIELILIERYVVTVNRLTCGLLQGRQVHYGTAYHILLALPLWHRLEEKQRMTLPDRSCVCVLAAVFVVPGRPGRWTVFLGDKPLWHSDSLS